MQTALRQMTRSSTPGGISASCSFAVWIAGNQGLRGISGNTASSAPPRSRVFQRLAEAWGIIGVNTDLADQSDRWLREVTLHNCLILQCA
jgi:hypothetical protein